MLLMVNIRTKQLHLFQAWSRNSKGTTAGSKYRMKPERVNLTKQIFRNGKCQSHTNPNYDYEHNKIISRETQILKLLVC